MANTSSAKKAVRVIAKRSERNRSVRTSIKNTIKKVVKAKPEQAVEALRTAYTALDQAAAKKIIHKNKAARQKSRLAKKVAKVTTVS